VGAMVKKVLRYGAIAFVIFFVAFRPDSAAQAVRTVGSGIMDIASGFGDFFANLAS
jgi:hypothetical protein